MIKLDPLTKVLSEARNITKIFLMLFEEWVEWAAWEVVWEDLRVYLKKCLGEEEDNREDKMDHKKLLLELILILAKQ